MHHGPIISLVPLNDIKIGQKQVQDDMNIINIEPNNGSSGFVVRASGSQVTELYSPNNSSYKYNSG